MNRRTRTIIVVAVAIVLASLASFGVYRAIRNIPRVEVPIATNFAVVAKDRIPVGVLLSADMVKRVPWPADTPVPASFSQPEEVVGRGVTAAFAANEPITEDKLAAKNMGGGLPPQIPQGMRAMSVRVNDVVAVAGFTTPGTRVDVLVTVKANQEPISRVVLSNVQVLTANTKYEVEKNQQGQSMPITIVTFLLTPQDAEKMALAQNEGQIMLALRNPLDVAATETQGARMSSLFGAPAPPPVRKVVQGQTRMVPPPPPPPPPPPNTVEMVRAGKKGEVIIKK
ncbi:MAG TPA: Flp pilus assembly protein CpaB [Vicinamibacterales bacterium]|nr:Flp pilus assembly protein CpaB [Vicinamibacterales bacterium]